MQWIEKVPYTLSTSVYLHFYNKSSSAKQLLLSFPESILQRRIVQPQFSHWKQKMLRKKPPCPWFRLDVGANATL